MPVSMLKQALYSVVPVGFQSYRFEFTTSNYGVFFNSPGTGEYPAQMASIAENVSIWWRHHVFPICEVMREINTKITLGWAHKEFATAVHTLFYFLHNITNAHMTIKIRSSHTGSWLTSSVYVLLGPFSISLPAFLSQVNDEILASVSKIIFISMFLPFMPTNSGIL